MAGSGTRKSEKDLKNIDMLTVRNVTKQEVTAVIFPNGIIVGADGPKFKNGMRLHGNAQISGVVNSQGYNINGEDLTTFISGRVGAITVYVSPLSVLFSTDKAGTITDNTPGETTFTVYEGNDQLLVHDSVSAEKGTFRITTPTVDGIAAGAVTHNNETTVCTAVGPTSMLGDTASITWKFVVTNSTGVVYSQPVTQTFAKSKDGDDGDDGDAGASGADAQSAAFTRSSITISTDSEGGATDDGGDLTSSDIGTQAFTKMDVNVGATNVTFDGAHDDVAVAIPTNNTYRILNDDIKAYTNNGTDISAAISMSPLTVNDGDTGFTVVLKDSGGRIKVKLTVSSDNSDLKILVIILSKYEDNGITEYDSVDVEIPIRVRTDAGTQTLTRRFEIVKNKFANPTLILPLALDIDRFMDERALVGHAIMGSAHGQDNPQSMGIITSTIDFDNLVDSDTSLDVTLATGETQTDYNNCVFYRVPTGRTMTLLRAIGALNLHGNGGALPDADITMNVYRTNTDDLTDSTLKLVAQMEIDGSGTAFAIDVEGSYTLDTGVPPFYSSNTFTEGYGLAFVVHCSAVNDVGAAGTTSTGFLNVEYTLY